MGKILDFAEALARRQARDESKPAHQLSLVWVEQRTKTAAVCSCGIEFDRWRPENCERDGNLDRLRVAYRQHVEAVTGVVLPLAVDE